MVSFFSDKISMDNVDYPDFTSVLNEVLATCIIDIRRFTPYLNPDYLECLEPAPVGVYLSGMVDPVVDFRKTYFIQKGNSRVWITNYEDFIAALAGGFQVLDDRGVVVANPTKRAKEFYHENCSLPYSAVKLLEIELFDFIRSFRREISVYSNIPRENLNAINFIKADHIRDIHTFPNRAVQLMINEVDMFTANYRWNNYSLAFNNTSVMIHRHNDYRVIQYYARIFDQVENTKLSLG